MRFEEVEVVVGVAVDDGDADVVVGVVRVGGLVERGGARGDYVGGVEAGVEGVGLAGVDHEEHFVVAGEAGGVSWGGGFFGWGCRGGGGGKENTVSFPTSARTHRPNPSFLSPRCLGISKIRYPHGRSYILAHCCPHRSLIVSLAAHPRPGDPSTSE